MPHKSTDEQIEGLLIRLLLCKMSLNNVHQFKGNINGQWSEVITPMTDWELSESTVYVTIRSSSFIEQNSLSNFSISLIQSLTNKTSAFHFTIRRDFSALKLFIMEKCVEHFNHLQENRSFDVWFEKSEFLFSHWFISKKWDKGWSRNSFFLTVKSKVFRWDTFCCSFFNW